MEYVRRTVNGAELNNFISLPLSLRDKRVEIIVQPVSDDIEDMPKRQFDFGGGPELPDSFFDPLSEEELQSWGL